MNENNQPIYLNLSLVEAEIIKNSLSLMTTTGESYLVKSEDGKTVGYLAELCFPLKRKIVSQIEAQIKTEEAKQEDAATLPGLSQDEIQYYKKEE